MTTAAQIITERRRHRARWLRDLLRSEVMAGTYGDGSLPSEAQLMQTYGLTRAVVREALELLRGEGVIERVPGTGTFVLVQRQLLRLEEFDVALPAVGSDSFVQIIACEVTVMPTYVAGRLGSTPGSQCLLHEYLVMRHAEPLSIHTSYVRFPQARAYQAAAESGQIPSPDQCGNDRVVDLLIDSVVADADLAELLDIAVAAPLLGLERVVSDSAGQPYLFSLIRSRGDRSSFLSRATKETLTHD